MAERCKHDHLMVRVHDSYGWDLVPEGGMFDLPEVRELSAYCYDCERRWRPQREDEAPRWLRKRYECLAALAEEAEGEA